MTCIIYKLQVTEGLHNVQISIVNQIGIHWHAPILIAQEGACEYMKLLLAHPATHQWYIYVRPCKADEL